MTSLALDVNNPETTSQNLQKLLVLYQNDPSDQNRAIFVSTFVLSESSEPIIILHLLKIMKKSLKIDFSLHTEILATLPSFLTVKLTKECQIIFIDLYLACLYLLPPHGDYLLEHSLPQNSSQIFPITHFNTFLDLILTTPQISKTGLNILLFRIKQYKDLFFHSLFYCKNIKITSQKQLILIYNLLSTDTPQTKFFDFSAEKLAVPVAFRGEKPEEFLVEMREIEVVKQVKNEKFLLSLEPEQKQSQSEKLKELTQKKRLQNLKYKQAEFEVFHVLEYGCESKIQALKVGIFNNVVGQFGELCGEFWADLDLIVTEFSDLMNSELNDVVLRLYQGEQQVQLPMLILMLKSIRGSNNEVMNFYGKVYDQITVENFVVDNKKHIYYILKSIFCSKASFLTKLAILLKLNSIVLHVPSDAQFYIVLLTLSAFLRETALRFLISQEQEVVDKSASQIVMKTSFDQLVVKLTKLADDDDLESIQLLEWRLLEVSTFNSVFQHIQSLKEGCNVENDLDLDEFASLTLQKVISANMKQRQNFTKSSLFVGENLPKIEKKMFTGEGKDIAFEDYRAEIERKAHDINGGELILQSVKYAARSQVFTEIQQNINQLWDWQSGEVKKFVCAKEVGKEIEEEVAEEVWQGEQGEEFEME